jgi:hypothetical protein
MPAWLFVRDKKEDSPQRHRGHGGFIEGFLVGNAVKRADAQLVEGHG